MPSYCFRLDGCARCASQRGDYAGETRFAPCPRVGMRCAPSASVAAGCSAGVRMEPHALHASITV